MVQRCRAAWPFINGGGTTKKLSRKLLGIASAVAAAGTLALTGITGAAASGSSSGFIHVTLMGTNPANNATRTIIITGSITAGGIDHPGNQTDNVVFLSLIHI